MAQSPWESAPVTRKKALADWPRFSLQTLDNLLVFAPFQFTLTAGVPSAPNTGHRFWLEQVAAGSQRLYAPNCPQQDIYSFASRSQSTALTVDRSGIGSSATSRLGLATGAATNGTVYGFTAAREGRAKASTDVNITNGPIPSPTDYAAGKTLDARRVGMAKSYIKDMTLCAFRWKVLGAAGAPDPSTAVGWPNFNVLRTGAGAYTITTGIEFPAGSVVVADCDTRGVTASLAGNTITLTTLSGAVATDPTTGSEVRILILAPAKKAGQIDQQKVNTSKPNALSNYRGQNYPAFAIQRGEVFIPFNFSTDAGGDIIVGPNTIIPDGVKLFRSATNYVLEIGACRTDMIVAAAQSSGAVVGLPVTYPNLTDNGRITIIGTLASVDVSGWIMACPRPRGER